MRMANNKHWLSDVTVGAGVGILAAEFGYWIADAILKDRGLHHKDEPDEASFGYTCPSFLGLYLGFNVPLNKYDASESVSYETSTGRTLGLEGAYFFNRYAGFGGRATISNMHFIVNGTEAPENTLKFCNFSMGPHLSYPFTPRWTIGTKFLANFTSYGNAQIGTVSIPCRKGWGFDTGLSIGYQVRRHFGVSILSDYNLLSPHSTYSDRRLHTLTLSGRVMIRF